MSAVVATRRYPVPRGASALERATIRSADAVTRWVTRRAEQRQDRRERILLGIKEQQTRRADARAVEHELARMGLPRK